MGARGHVEIRSHEHYWYWYLELYLIHARDAFSKSLPFQVPHPDSISRGRVEESASWV